MKRLAWAIGLVLAAAPVRAAELKILEPKDRTVVRGTIQFRIQPVHDEADQFLSNPEITIQDEYGRTVHKLRAARDPKTQICSVPLDTLLLRDGICLASITYRTLVKGTTPREVREDLTLGIRNKTQRVARFTIDLPDKQYRLDELCDFTVRVFDQNKHRMSGARVTFKISAGELDTDAEITDGTGEAYASVTSETAQSVTLTIQVENLPPVNKIVRFVE